MVLSLQLFGHALSINQGHFGDHSPLTTMLLCICHLPQFIAFFNIFRASSLAVF